MSISSPPNGRMTIPTLPRKNEELVLSAETRADAMVPASPEPLLEVRGLHKHFGGVRAVDDVSLTLLPGQTIGVIGPNG